MRGRFGLTLYTFNPRSSYKGCLIMDHKHCDHCDLCGHHAHSVKDELICHIPYAIMSLAISFVLLSTFHFLGQGIYPDELLSEGYHILFHSFHYLHIVVAVAGAVIAFFRQSNRIILGSIISLVVPTIFCIMSDIMLPTLSGRLLGVPMEMHICFCEFNDAINLIAFMVMGYICGMALLYNKDSLKTFSLTFHFFHILISSMASTFYMVAHGFDCWYDSMGLLFFFLFIAIIVPCTFSDVVVPYYCARASKRRALVDGK
ncbi:MAG: hypothetical protein UW09_C0001G0085 [candidate division TM6 bacterium GW2011_GWF2_43_87]|nr:MAG: hypothetical protein UW09_C0001G0085 [candidate division TM6 bacterium GW2011_GWF2_43_87]